MLSDGYKRYARARIPRMHRASPLFRIRMRHLKSICLFVTVQALSLLALAAPLSAGTRQGPAVPGLSAQSLFDLEYANVGGQSLKLDLLLPDGAGPFPVIVSIHGGSWDSGTRDQGIAFLQVSRGYAVANIDYRLVPGSIFPAQIEDVKAAVRWLRANATRFNLNPNRIGAMGYSAGGHLAALLGTSAGVEELEGAGHGNPGFSSRVQAVVDYFGPTDLLRLAEQAPACLPGDPDDPAQAPSRLIGCPIQECPEKTTAANPIHYVSPDDSPFLILHGLADCLVPWQQSQILHDALLEAGVESKLILVPGLAHADPLFLLPTLQSQVEAFLDQHLMRAGPARRTRPARR